MSTSMKPKTKTARPVIPLLGLSCACISATLFAGTNTVSSGKPVGHHIRPEALQFDANQNGRLDHGEMEAMRKERIRDYREQQKARKEADIEARKLEEAARRTRRVPPALLQQYDTDSNGLIDLVEWKNYRADVIRRTTEKNSARLGATNTAPAGLSSTNAPSAP